MSPYIFLIALFAEIIGTVAGFGSSTIFLPLALLFLDFKTALVLVAFFHIFGNISRLGFFRYGLKTKLLITFAIPSVIATLLGAFLAASISQTWLKLLLGIFLVVYSLVSLLWKSPAVPPTTTNSVIGGGVSGFLAGIIGTGGALRSVFLNAFKLPKEQYIATAAAIALAVDATRLPVYLTADFFPTEYYKYLPVFFVIALCGSFIGKQVVKRVSQKKFRMLVLVALLLVGIKFVVDSQFWF